MLNLFHRLTHKVQPSRLITLRESSASEFPGRPQQGSGNGDGISGILVGRVSVRRVVLSCGLPLVVTDRKTAGKESSTVVVKVQLPLMNPGPPE